MNDDKPMGRGQDINLLHALNAAAASLQRSAHSEAGVFQAFSEQISKLGLYGSLGFLSEDGKQLAIRIMVRPENALEKLGQWTGKGKTDLIIDISRLDIYPQVIRAGETVFRDNNNRLIAHILREGGKIPLQEVLDNFGGLPAIYAPLLSEGSVSGMVSVVGSQLTPGAIPAMEAFANHISIALENARLFTSMQRAEARYRSLFETANDGILLIDAQTTQILSANSKFSDLSGYSEDELAGMIVFRLHPDNIQEEIRRSLDGLTATGRVTLEAPLLRKDGLARVVHISANTFTVDGQKILQVVVHDATELKQMELDLHHLLEAERHRRQESEIISQATLALTSSLDLDKVLKDILTHLEKVVPYDSAAIFLLERGSLRIVAAQGFPADVAIVGNDFPAENGLFQEIQKTGRPLILQDAFEDPRFKGWGETSSVRSWMGVPLTLRKEVIGYVTLDNHQHAIYSLPQATLAEVFANQAAIAIENARLFEAERAAREQAETLREVTQVVSSSLDLDEVLHLILGQLKRVLTFDTTSVILLGERGHSALVAGVGYADQKLTSQIASEVLTESPILKQMAREFKPVVIPDVHKNPDWIWVEGATHVHSFLAVPIIIRQQMIGALMIDNRQIDFFDENDVHTAQSLAQHMAIAIQNARLFEAERTARERAEALREASAIIGSTLSLDQVLKTVLDQLARVLSFDTGNVMLLENQKLAIKVSLNYEKFVDASLVNEVSFDISADQVAALVVRTDKPIVVTDTTQDSRWEKTVAGAHVRSWLGVPLKVREQVIGVLNLDREYPGGFTEEEITLAKTFAAHASTAIENARLFEAEEKRAAELEAIRRASLSLTASLELPQVLDAILNSVMLLLPGASNTHIFLYSTENGGQLKFGAALWSDGRRGHPVAMPRPNGLTYNVARRGEIIVVHNMRTHPLFVDAPHTWQGAIVGLPLKIGQRVVGVMNTSYQQPHNFTEAELRLLGLLGDQAAIAIENARLFEQAATERVHLGLLYDVGRELATSLDTDEILDRAISLTSNALGGLMGVALLYLPEDDSLSLRAIHGLQIDSVAELDARLNLHLGMGLAGWVAQHRTPVNAPDVSQDPRWLLVPGLDEDARSVLAAPILAGDRLLGVLSVLHRQPAAFSRDHLELMQAICQEVGLALSNASRYQQVQRRLAEITLIQNLAQTFNQRLELQVLLEEVVNQLAQRLGYPQVRIFLVEDDGLVLRACYGPRPPRDRYGLFEGAIGRVARTGQVNLIQDISQDEEYLGCIPETAAELVVPIFRNNTVIGVINIETDQSDQLGTQDRDLLQVLAGQISIALENAVLYERVRRHADDLEHTVEQRTAELMELYEFSQEIGYSLSYGDLLRLLLNHLRNAMRGELVVGCLLLENSRMLAIETSRPIAQNSLDSIRNYWREMLTSRVDALAEWESIPLEVIPADEFDASQPEIGQLSSLISAPIITGQKTIGILIAGSEIGEAFGAEHKRLLSTFANQAGAAIERLATILAAEQKRLEALVEHLPVGVLLLDSEYRLLVANPLGTSIMSTLNDGRTDGVLSHLGPCSLQDLISHHIDPIPMEIALEGAHRRYFEAQARPMGDQNSLWVLTLREVTQERDNQARIQMQERLATVGQLAAGIAHDFNNIMAAILVYADLLRNDPSLPDMSRERLMIIQQQVQRAASLIRQILDFSRRSVMEQSSMDLLPFIKELDKMLGRVMPETIHVELSYRAESYLINADPTRLQQVFMNLALNARDAMPEGGLLHFELDRLALEPGEQPPTLELPPGDWLRISVRDTGIGIPPENIPHIFEPFFTTKPVGQGTGLGLAQVYGIIKQHDGYIDVHSEVGQGTTFTIYLPAVPAAKEEPISQETPTPLNGVGETVLVVEDDRATREALQALLEAHNYQVLTAANGAAALKLIEKMHDSVALIVSDVVMPQMGGMALYRALQENWPEVKMLFITGHPMEGESQALLEGGSVHWLQKPFSVHEFSQAIQSLLREN